MKTKIIPFDLETAKKIQEGKIKGEIKTRNGIDARIICWDKRDKDEYCIVALLDEPEREFVASFTNEGRYDRELPNADCNLILEVSNNEPQFKPFDKVLVRNKSTERWHPSLYATTDGLLYYTIDCNNWQQCILYSGNESLVGTTDKPKED